MPLILHWDWSTKWRKSIFGVSDPNFAPCSSHLCSGSKQMLSKYLSVGLHFWTAFLNRFRRCFCLCPEKGYIKSLGNFVLKLRHWVHCGVAVEQVFFMMQKIEPFSLRSLFMQHLHLKENNSVEMVQQNNLKKHDYWNKMTLVLQKK